MTSSDSPDDDYYESIGWKDPNINPSFIAKDVMIAALKAENEKLLTKVEALETHNVMLRACIKGIIKVADRKTDEFDAARAALGGNDATN